MRLPALPLLLLLAACDGPGLFAAGAVNVASLTLTGRAVPDLVVSGVSGRDCSVARLDRGQSYCGASNAEPAPAPFCTRSLGSVDCWTMRPVAIPPQRGVGDAPVPVGGDMRHWPYLW
ncbi:MAG: hypothetical protein H7345_04905 [Rubritepida sp.]|nr:hypothetical protein [Rubritepida sp.]